MNITASLSSSCACRKFPEKHFLWQRQRLTQWTFMMRFWLLFDVYVDRDKTLITNKLSLATGHKNAVTTKLLHAVSWERQWSSLRLDPQAEPINPSNSFTRVAALTWSLNCQLNLLQKCLWFNYNRCRTLCVRCSVWRKLVFRFCKSFSFHDFRRIVKAFLIAFILFHDFSENKSSEKSFALFKSANSAAVCKASGIYEKLPRQVQAFVGALIAVQEYYHRLLLSPLFNSALFKPLLYK